MKIQIDIGAKIISSMTESDLYMTYMIYDIVTSGGNVVFKTYTDAIFWKNQLHKSIDGLGYILTTLQTCYN